MFIYNRYAISSQADLCKNMKIAALIRISLFMNECNITLSQAWAVLHVSERSKKKKQH
jgi:hypothetical protein